MIFKYPALRRGEVVTIDSSDDERGSSRRHRGGSRRDTKDDVQIVSHNREDEYAKMLAGDSEGDDDEAKVN